MDVISLIASILKSVWYLTPLVILAAILRSAWFKGIFGEFIVNLFISHNLDKQIYHLIKNVTLPTENGTTQIDHILVSKFGVFVIETKNMKGWIFGSPHQKQWIQRIYKHSSKFQNPLHQNYKHLKTLESCLGIPVESFFSVIVFVGDSTFKTEMPENVTRLRSFIGFIKSKTDAVLNQQQVNRVIAMIESGRLKPGLKTNREHAQHVKQIVRTKAHSKSCPKCGSEMVIREAKRGKNKGSKFYGCSAFPKCRAMEKIQS